MEEWIRLSEPCKRYYISNLGSVWDSKKSVLVEGSVEKNVHRVRLTYDDGIKRYVNTGKLVAYNFLANPNNYTSIKHINEDVTDNSVKNISLVPTRVTDGCAIEELDMDYKLIRKWFCKKELAKHLNVKMDFLSYSIHYEIAINGSIFKAPKYDRICLSKRRKVSKYSLDGKHLTSYETIASAAVDNSISQSAIVMACRGISKTSAGCVWKYQD